MTEINNTMDVLTSQVVDDRRKGHSFEEIAANRSVKVTEVVNAWKSYVDNRMVMSEEEQWVLHLIRLEFLLTQVNDRLSYADKAEDYELVIKLLDRIAALQALNKDLKKDADDKLVQITKAQTQVILQAIFALSNGVHAHIEQAFENGKTIKTIKAELTGETFRQNITAEAQKALTEGMAA